MDGVATKQDLALQQMATSKEFAELRLEMNGQFSAAREEFAAVRSEMKTGFAELRHELLFKTGIMFTAGLSLAVAILTWIIK